MIANAITISRIPLLALTAILLYQEHALPRIVAAFLTILLIVLDSLDGYIARIRGETSLLGSVLDIAADRTVEFVLWVVYADLDLIPIAIPLIVLARGTFVDAVRAVAPARGVTPFDLMRSKISRFMVKSPVFRTSFAIAKAAAFFLLALGYGLTASGHAWADSVSFSAQICAWLAFALCLARGIPVLVEAPRILQEPSKPPSQ
ncbi:MAG: CDP-alcohol phosphatidyltransferase family protein [Anaerolineae bacterium]|nr:CDP-alcohol phosphatidyltransferase family protein [Anaerolineae bacterium]